MKDVIRNKKILVKYVKVKGANGFEVRYTRGKKTFVQKYKTHRSLFPKGLLQNVSFTTDFFSPMWMFGSFPLCVNVEKFFLLGIAKLTGRVLTA